MRAEYDFSDGERGKHADKMSECPEVPVPPPLEQHLLDLLEWTRNGSIRAVVVCGVGMDGATFSTWCSGDRADTVLMLGETICLQQRLTDRIRAVNEGDI